MPDKRRPASPAPETEKRAWLVDTARQAVDGSFEPLVDSVFMLVAIGFFATGDFWKGLIAGSKFLGYLLSAPLTGFLNRSGVRRSSVLCALTGLSAASLAAATLAPGGVLFAISAATASAALNLRQPFFTDLYGESYPAARRARRISLGLRLSLLASLGTGLLYGRILEADLSLWRWITGGVAVVMVAASVMIRTLPEGTPVPRSECWWQALALPFRNPVFLYVQAAWMFVGFGNIWTLPLRAVYLAESGRGLGLSPATVTLVLVIVPAAARFAFNPMWAALYRKMSFPALRVTINTFFMTSIPLFFLTDSLPVILAAAALFGIATSGSPFIWQLWVTRIVAPGEVRLYQSAHAFLAGVRGVIAPFIGFAVLGGMSFREMGLLSGVLTAISSLMMIPLMRKDRIF